MKSIMRELYYGNISSPKDIRIPEKTRKKEAAIYEKLKATLSERATNFLKNSSTNPQTITMNLCLWFTSADCQWECSLPAKRLLKEISYETQS